MKITGLIPLEGDVSGDVDSRPLSELTVSADETRFANLPLSCECHSGTWARGADASFCGILSELLASERMSANFC